MNGNPAMRSVARKFGAASGGPSPAEAARVILHHYRLPLGAGAAVAVVLVFTLWLLAPSGGSEQTSLAGRKAWYTTDDGKTWFADEKQRIVPFTHNGKEAYRCWVYSCDNGTTKFVAYVERYSPAARQQLEAAASSRQAPAAGVIDELLTTGTEVKRPGESAWISISDPRAVAVREPKCPAGSGKTPQLVVPP